MKKIIAGIVFVVIFNVQAQTTSAFYSQPSEADIQKNRLCFQEIENLGCGTLEEDHQKFRSCMSDVHEKLSIDCKKMMLGLYGSKD